MKICAHTLVKNEERFLWFAVTSVVEHVDRVLLWDTGSTDKTIKIAEALKKRYPEKIDFLEVGNITASEFPKMRQKMLNETKADWFLVVDGDEIWWDESIRKVVKTIKKEGKDLDGIFVPTINLVGDMYHYQEEAAGKYKIQGKMGHLALRAINRNIPGLASRNPHGTWGWVDGEDKMVQERKKIKFVDAPYMHTTFLRRSGSFEDDKKVPKRKLKRKYELGIPFLLDYFYPESFFRDRPRVVRSVWDSIDTKYLLKSTWQTPLKKVKRRLVSGKPGY